MKSKIAFSLVLAVWVPCYAADSVVAKDSGARVYDTYCHVCHGTGWQGAPVTATDDWDPRIAKGLDVMIKNTLAGLNGMPPKGTCEACTDAELRAAIELMIAK